MRFLPVDRLFPALVFVFALWFAGCSKQQDVKPYTIEQFMNTTSIAGSSISFDDRHVLFSSRKTGVFNAFTVPVTGGEPVQLTHSDSNSVFAVSYFPSDNRILYSSDQDGNEITHIYLREENGNTKDLTPDSSARAQFYGWSHDQRSFFYGSNRRDPRFFDLYEMQIDGFQTKEIYRNAEGLDVAAISNDKRYLALIRTITEHNNEMFVVDRLAGKLEHISNHTGDVLFFPETFSVDSKELYYLTNEGKEFQYLKSYNITSGTSRLIEDATWDIMFAAISRSGRYRVIGVDNDARTEIRILNMETGQPVRLPVMEDADITSVKISDSEKQMTFYVNGSRSPNNLYVFNFEDGKVTKLTDTMNPEIDQKDLVVGQVIRYTSFDGMEIPALLYLPHQASPDNNVPALVMVHGGPGGQARFGYSALKQFIVNHGYAIIDVNNRGSSGYGKTFYKADDLKHGNEDLRDCVAAKTFLATLGVVDTSRVGIIGGSYGGYMVLAAMAFDPTQFSVGVDIFGVSNWLRTLKSIPPYWESFRKALYAELGDPTTPEGEEFLKAKSPLFHAENIRRPLIVLQGANDPRVLKVESDEIVEAVRKNNVPVEYVVFPDEGHGFVKRENEIQGYKAILDFLEKHLKRSNA